MITSILMALSIAVSSLTGVQSAANEAVHLPPPAPPAVITPNLPVDKDHGGLVLVEAEEHYPRGPVVLPTLHRGSLGPFVIMLQSLLGVHNQDGVFGSHTVRAVKRYQWEQGLPVTGVVGNMTWHSLTSGTGFD